jgi:hypothetical protein
MPSAIVILTLHALFCRPNGRPLLRIVSHYHPFLLRKSVKTAGMAFAYGLTRTAFGYLPYKTQGANGDHFIKCTYGYYRIGLITLAIVIVRGGMVQARPLAKERAAKEEQHLEQKSLVAPLPQDRRLELASGSMVPGEQAFNQCLKLPENKRIKITLKPQSDLHDVVGWISSMTTISFTMPVIVVEFLNIRWPSIKSLFAATAPSTNVKN